MCLYFQLIYIIIVTNLDGLAQLLRNIIIHTFFLDPTTQQAAFVPGSFSSTTGGPKDQPCNSTCYREMIMQDAEEYFKWAKEDTRIGGIFPALAKL